MEHALYEQHDRQERDHWWFRGRRAIVLAELQRALPRTEASPSILDVGCGTGENLIHLAAIGPAFGVEPSVRAATRAAEKARAPVVAAALPHLPFADGTFDVVTALDVIEHVDDDALAVLELSRVLAPGGLLVVTVPALRALWSSHDEANHHRRRYARAELRRLLSGPDLALSRLTYFNSALFAPVAASRILSRRLDRIRGRGPAPRSDLEWVPPAPLNELLFRLFDAERHALALADLPVGVSLLAVARRI